MKNRIFLCLMALLYNFHLGAQLFQLATGPVNTKFSDSRSANFLDLNNDGWEDVFISNGLASGQKDLLYLNDGTGVLKAITDMEIVNALSPADGASFADYNNDGHIDGVVSSWHGAEDLLYLNDGNGQLKYNANAGMAKGSFAEAASFGDYDGDGWLDLYITNSAGGNVNYLYRNLQNGKFQRVESNPLLSESKPSRGVIWGDFNNDGLQDIFISNESNQANDLYFGQGNGQFEKLNRGSIVVDANGSMTASWGDIDNDGDFDLFVGNSGFFAGQSNQLFRNFGNSFGQVSSTVISEGSRCSFGSAFGDYDNDGDLDLMVTNGFCNANMSNQLYENQGDGTFVEVSQHLVNNLNVCSFGVAWGDVDNNGFLDLLIANCKNAEAESEKRNILLMNSGNDNNWLQLKLEGIQSNSSAIGAKIRAKAIIDGKEVWQIREIRAQSGYAGQNSLIAHFGLGDAERVDSLIILWPAGGVQVLENIRPNQKLTIQEGITSNVNKDNALAGVKLEIFPNPFAKSNDSLQIQIDSPNNFRQCELFIFNAWGQLLRTEAMPIEQGASSFSLDSSWKELPAGLYHLVLRTRSGQIGKKVIKQ